MLAVLGRAEQRPARSQLGRQRCYFFVSHVHDHPHPCRYRGQIQRQGLAQGVV